MDGPFEKHALLVIDMQNDFFDPGGPFAERQEALPADLVPNVLATIRWARQHRVPVIHVIQEHRPGRVDYGRELDLSPPHCVENTPGADIIPQIGVDPGDYRVIKRRFSGFLHTDLDLLLRGLEVETVVLCGIAGDGCVRATALDASQLGYRLRLVTDAVAGQRKESCAAALEHLATLQPGVCWTTGDLG